MKLSGQIYIDPAKIRDYLLVPKSVKDKSKFFGYAGYFRENWENLYRDIFDLSENDAEYVGKTNYGEEEYEIKCILKGRNKISLEVNLIFHYSNNQSRLITVEPVRILK
jgi:hypothetical protein